MNWHQLTTDQVTAQLETSGNGLSERVATQRISVYGTNTLQEQKKKQFWQLLLRQFSDFMILVLLAAAVLSGLIGNVTDAIIILVIVVLNALIGCIQEYRAARAVTALKQLTTPYTQVLRDGSVCYIAASQVVPGDIALLETGNLVPADIRLLESHALRIEESALTGEAIPTDKITDALPDGELALGDRRNMAYKGTKVVYGRGTGIVVATGMHTELGGIAGILQENEKKTPLQQRMLDFGKKLSWLIMAICLLLFLTGLMRGEQPLNMLLLATSLAVAAIPEALPALITITLALGAKKMVKKNVLIRKLPAVETLGAVTFICTDKTGTLTQNKMKVTRFIPVPTDLKLSDDFSPLECAMAVNHDVRETQEGTWTGDPTEIALVDYIVSVHSRKALQQINAILPRIAELPFDSERKCMTTIHRYKDRFIVISKGAAEKIFGMLAEDQHTEQAQKDIALMAGEGMRALAFGYKIIDSLPEPFCPETVEYQLRFAGLTGMADPPRAEVKQAIKACRSAGITPVMITGDHLQTAIAIGKQIGLLQEKDLVVSGDELAAMSEEELAQKVEHIRIYARVSPLQKLNIVKALQSKNHFVAMTGDGVNDAPSLSAANIGVAMGITGTDVSKEAAHMILLDDNFATIVKAIKEGRRIYDNIRKFVKYILTCNSAEIAIIFLAPLLGLPVPLLPIQILWINLVTDSLPGLALATEKAERNIMQRPPRKYNESLFADGIGRHIIWAGLFLTGITIGTQAVSLAVGNTHWQTMVFTVLSLAQLAHIFAIRSDHEFIYRKGIFSNPALLVIILATFLLQLAVIYLPWANRVFKTQPLSIGELLITIVIAASIFHAVELEKWIFQKRHKRSAALN